MKKKEQVIQSHQRRIGRTCVAGAPSPWIFHPRSKEGEGGGVPESKFDPCCAIPSFPPPDFRFFSGRGGRQSRGDSCARAHLEERRIMQPRMSRGRAHTPLPPLLWKPRGGAARATRNAIPKG